MIARYLLPLALLLIPALTAAADFIVIGGDHDYPPYEYLTERGEPTGYNVELTRAVAEVMGLEVEIRLGPWAETREALLAGRIDAIHGMFYSPERDRNVDFSTPHTIVYHSAFSRLGGPPLTTEAGLSGRSIAVMRGDIMHDYLLEKGITDRIAAYDTQADALKDLADGDRDYALVAKLPGLYWIDQLSLDNLTPTGPPLRPAEYCYAVRDGTHPELLAAFNRGLAILNQSGRYAEIYQKWFTPLEHPSALPSEYLYGIAFGFAILLLLLAGSVFWTWTVKRQVRTQTDTLIREIEERRKAERASKESEARYRRVFDGAPIGIVTVQPDGRITAANPFFCRMLGYTEEELLSMTVAEITHPEDLAREVPLIREIMEGKRPSVQLEKRYLTKGGDPVWAELVTTSIRDMDGRLRLGLGMVVDISRRKQLDTALRESEERWHFALEGAGDGVWDWDARTDRVFFSEQWKAMLGFAGHEIGETLDEWDSRIHPEDRAQTHADLDRHLEGETPYYRNEHRVRCKDGSYKWVLDRGKVMEWTADGKPLRIIGTHSDITDRKAAEAEREALLARLHQVRKTESLNRMAGAVAHIFNNHLSVVIGRLEMALDDIPHDGWLRDHLSAAMTSAEDAAQVSGAMLVYLGQTNALEKPLDLGDCCRRSLKTLEAIPPETVRLQTDISPAPLTVTAEEARLKEIFTTLVRNAVEAIGDGDGVVGLTTKFVRADEISRTHLFPSDREPAAPLYVCLEVSDTGCGMADGDIERVFDPFFSTKFPGRGLSLPLALGAVKSWGGAIGVESRPGRGSTFRVYLPRMEPDEISNSV